MNDREDTVESVIEEVQEQEQVPIININELAEALAAAGRR